MPEGTEREPALRLKAGPATEAPCGAISRLMFLPHRLECATLWWCMQRMCVDSPTPKQPPPSPK